jgi:hypothetical protein
MDTPFDCSCGSPDCLGRVGGFKFLGAPDIEKLFNLLSPFIRTKLQEIDWSGSKGPRELRRG